MQSNLGRTRMQAASGVVPLDAVKKIVQEMQNPIKPEKLIQGDGGALRAYNFHLFKKH